MANLSNLLAHIANFLKGLLDDLLKVLGLYDTSKNLLDEAASNQESLANKE